MAAVELDVSPEILQVRSEALIKSIRIMIEQGLDRDGVARVHQTSPRSHRDFLMLYLGLKPASLYLGRAFEAYHHSGTDRRWGSHLWHFPTERDTGLTVNIDLDGAMAWNPELVKTVLTRNSQLVDQVDERYRREVPDVVESDRDFRYFMWHLSRKNHVVLEGQILGYPLMASILFERYWDAAPQAAKELWATSTSNGLEVPCQAPKSMLEFELNRDGCRDVFLQLAALWGHVDPHLIEYIKGLRPAEVPGYAYSTYGDLTRSEEAKITSLYEASGLEKKLGELLGL